MEGTEWTAGDLQSWLRSRRRQPGRSWSDWYVLIFAAAIVLPMVFSLAKDIGLPLLTCSSGSTTCAASLALLPFTWVASSSLVVAAVSSLLGPLAASAATASWILATPIDRESLLAPDLTRIVVIGLGVGLLSGALLWVLAGGSPLWIAACAASAVLAILSAVLAQQSGGWHALRASILVAAATLILLGTFALTHLVSPVLVAAVIVLGTSLLAWRAAMGAKAGLGTMSRFSLARHSRTRTALAGATSGADAGLALDILALHLGGTGAARGLSPRGVGWRALAGYETRRLVRRSPRLLFGIAGTATAALFIPVHPMFGLALACVALVPALGLTLSSLRVVLRSRGLARTLGLGRRTQISALAVGAALTAAVWAVICGLLLIASGLPLLTASLLASAVGISGLAGALRWVAAPPPDFAGGIIVTDAGPVPVAALLRTTTGFDTAFAMAGLLLVGAPPVLCAALACLALAWSIIRTSRLEGA